MKLYEEIYIPCEDNDVEAIGMVDGPYAKTFPIKCQLDVVVITIEELKEVWEAGEGWPLTSKPIYPVKE